MRSIGLKTKIFLGVLTLLVGARLALPYVVEHYLNKTLQNDVEGYTGSVADVDIHLIRGAYAIDSLKLLKKNGKVPVPFVSVRKIDFSVDWQALFDGSLVAEITARQPRINFVDGPSEAQTQTGEEGNWRETVQQLFPLNINRFIITDGRVHFQNLHASPKVDVYLNDIELVARNLTNSEKVSKTMVASINGTSRVMGDGKLNLRLDMNPLAENPPFDLDLAVEGVDLVRLNDFFRSYTKIDMEKGTFSLYSEVAGENNKFKGYVKPIFKDAKVLDLKDDGDKKPFRVLWEAGIGLVNTLFKNQREKQLATKIPISGDLSNPDVDTWTAVVKVLENAFVKAISPDLDGSVNLGNLGDTEKELKEEAKKDRKAQRKERREEKREERRERREEKKEEKKKEQLSAKK
jgi:hypothetical protein